MAKDVTKIVSLTVSKIEFGESTDGLEPSYTVDPGLIHDEKITLKIDPVSDKEIGGGNIQKGYEATFETSAMQVKDYATIEGLKNKSCWIKVTATSGSVVKIKNFFINIAADLTLATKGKSSIIVSGSKYDTAMGNIIAFA